MWKISLWFLLLSRADLVVERSDMYRPEGWKNPNISVHMRPDCVCHYCIEKKVKWDAYEAGADAMLEGLMKLAKESPTGTFEIDSREYHIYVDKE